MLCAQKGAAVLLPPLILLELVPETNLLFLIGGFVQSGKYDQEMNFS